MDFQDKKDDDFWDLSEFVPKSKRDPNKYKQFSKSATSAIEVKVGNDAPAIHSASDNRLTAPQKSSSGDSGTITRFIPPHSDPAFMKKIVLSEYTPKNPLIKSIRVVSDKPDDKLFVENNLFIRERRALLNRPASECAHASYYSYSPRYSQMSRAQLNWYLWWRENTRKGVFLKTDESYIMLYAYELCAVGPEEDKHAALDMLCSLYQRYPDKEISVFMRLMLRDMICDFCLLHCLPSPIGDALQSFDKSLLSNAFLPEFFLDLSPEKITQTLRLGLASLSMYDFRRSKFYSDETKSLFENAMNGAVAAIFEDETALGAILSFTKGMYGCVTAERKPFSRMINIVNKSIRLEITYYQISGIQAPITDAIRYAENRLRDHMGIKNKLQIMAVNPAVKDALDHFFNENYPPLPVIDRRRKNAVKKEEEVHEYDRLYDVPKAEISPERAIEIERESWATTKILTEAFANDTVEEERDDVHLDPIDENHATAEETHHPVTETGTDLFAIDVSPISDTDSGSDVAASIRESLGEISDFLNLCKGSTVTEQRKFASSHGLTLDELADRINECAVNVFGDIILEDDGSAYTIIEDYQNLF